MASVEAAGISKRFGRTPAVERVDLSVRDGEFITLLGPSGCGKTTLLRLIAGFESPDHGELRLDGNMVGKPGFRVPPENRNIGMVFQSYALWPHMTVSENVGFALRVRRVPAMQRERRVSESLHLVGLAGLEARRPSQLSGGQRQRVALARCLAMRPSVVLLDEPLSNLDAHLRETMQSEFRRFHHELGATFIYVTHDQAEAMALADRVVVMNSGRIEQVADPQRLYDEPRTEMVARFVGRGMLVEAEGVSGEETMSVVHALGAFLRVRGRAGPGERRKLCLRPADLRLTDAAEQSFAAEVTAAIFQGPRTLVTVRPAEGAPDLSLQVEHRGEAPAIGAVLRVAVDDGWVIPEPSV